MQVDFDPEQLSYDSLLTLFWGSHNPTNKPYRRQYMSLILTANNVQQERAELSAEQVHAKGGKIYTEIAPLTKFYLAEDYHQKFYLSRVPVLVQELKFRYPNFLAYINSTVVARINGYVGGYGSKALLESELANFKLSDEAQRRLMEIVSSY